MSRDTALAEGKAIRRALKYSVEFYSRPTENGRERRFKYTHMLKDGPVEAEIAYCNTLLQDLRRKGTISNRWFVRICRLTEEKAQIVILSIFPEVRETKPAKKKVCPKEVQRLRKLLAFMSLALCLKNTPPVSIQKAA